MPLQHHCSDVEGRTLLKRYGVLQGIAADRIIVSGTNLHHGVHTIDDTVHSMFAVTVPSRGGSTLENVVEAWLSREVLDKLATSNRSSMRWNARSQSRSRESVAKPFRSMVWALHASESIRLALTSETSRHRRRK